MTGTTHIPYLRSPSTKICVCEPDNAPLLFSGIKTEYGDESKGELTTFKEPHPCFRPHLLQGWTPDFIPKLVNDAVDGDLIDQVLHVGGDSAMAAAKDLAIKEGIFSGTSGGGNMACALELAKVRAQIPHSTFQIPDTGLEFHTQKKNDLGVRQQTTRFTPQPCSNLRAPLLDRTCS